MKKLFPILIFVLLLSACQPAPSQPPATSTLSSEDVFATALAADQATLEASYTSTPATTGAIATALAADAATQAAGPTKTPTRTPRPVPTIDPNMTYWWNDTVFYEVFVRSFYDSDGDGVGDINGLIEKLDYLNDGDPNTTDDLGVTGLWLMPIMESPSYHGYDVVNYYSVDQEYGTNEDFQRLMNEAHKRGIRIIVDLVLNHTSSQHPWFLESKNVNSPYRDWYIWSDYKPTYAGPWGQDVWHGAGSSYYYGVFWGGMPDLNLENPKVTAEIENITQFWINEMGVDGFRLDAIKHLIENGPAQDNTPATHEWLSNYYNIYKSTDPNIFAVGEAWTGTYELLEYTGDEVDVVFAFDLAEDFINTARGTKVDVVSARIAQMVNDFPAGQYATFISNHDQNRLMSQLMGDEDQAKLAATLLLTTPGVPFLYYGEEIGMSGVKPDEDIRLPLQWDATNGNAGFTIASPWRAPASDYKTRNIAAQTDDENSLLSHYRDLIHLRNEHPALRTGEWQLVESNSPHIYAFLRYTAEETLLVIVNANREKLTFSDYSLKLTNGTLPTGVRAVPLLGLENAQNPEINPYGGFDAYIPFTIIPAKGFGVIQLTP